MRRAFRRPSLVSGSLAQCKPQTQAGVEPAYRNTTIRAESNGFSPAYPLTGGTTLVLLRHILCGIFTRAACYFIPRPALHRPAAVWPKGGVYAKEHCLHQLKVLPLLLLSKPVSIKLICQTESDFSETGITKSQRTCADKSRNSQILGINSRNPSESNPQTHRFSR